MASVNSKPLQGGRRHGGFFNNAASGNAATGIALLSTFPAFWNGNVYSGSGAWLNQGTAGAALNLALGAATAAPTFVGDHWVFDGVDDTMSTPDNAALNFGGTAFTVGAVLSFPSTPALAQNIVCRKKAAIAGYQLTLSSVTQSGFTFALADASGSHFPAASTASGVPNATKKHITGTRVFQGSPITAYINGVAGTPATDTTTAAGVDNTGVFFVGSNNVPAAFLQMDLYGLYLTPTVITAQNMADIGAYFNAA